MNKLYIIDNGLFHYCKEYNVYHTTYIKIDNNYVCKFKKCNFKFPSILGLPFKISLGADSSVFIGSLRLVHKLDDINYEVIEL